VEYHTFVLFLLENWRKLRSWY